MVEDRRPPVGTPGDDASLIAGCRRPGVRGVDHVEFTSPYWRPDMSQLEGREPREVATKLDGLTRRERDQIDEANRSGLQPVVFIHGLWLLANSWEPWAAPFREAGLAPLTPGWPDDPETVAEARDDPERLARKRIGQVADHHAEIIAALGRRPAIVGHSFGGLLAQILAGRGLSAATVAISVASVPRDRRSNPYSEGLIATDQRREKQP